MKAAKKILNASHRPGNLLGRNGAHYSRQLLEHARADTDTVLKELGSQRSGLSEAEATSRLKQVGTNEIAREKHPSPVMRLLANIKNPLVLLLLALLWRGTDPIFCSPLWLLRAVSRSGCAFVEEQCCVIGGHGPPYARNPRSSTFICG